MKELYVFCEGATEQGFCKQVLAPFLFPTMNGCVHTIKTAFSKHHGRVTRGGVGKYAPLRRDIQNTLKGRHEGNVYFTSLIDLYALPADFPGKSSHVRNPSAPERYAVALEGAFADDIGDGRFVPHLQLHEYEAMLLTDPEAFRVSFDDCEAAIASLKEAVGAFLTVEHIDDGKETAPSKRIIKVLPAYEGLKPSAGPDIAEYIGIRTICDKCPHLRGWIERLRQLNW